jgi:mono/diheme cytochrome c family protein
MKRTQILAAGAFGSILTLGAVLFAADKAEHPSALFKEYCIKCHGEDGKANTPKGSQLMARDFTDEEFQSSKTDAQLIETVTKGHEDMPPFGKKLSQEQIQSLVKNDVRGFRKK